MKVEGYICTYGIQQTLTPNFWLVDLIPKVNWSFASFVFNFYYWQVTTLPTVWKEGTSVFHRQHTRGYTRRVLLSQSFEVQLLTVGIKCSTGGCLSVFRDDAVLDGKWSFTVAVHVEKIWASWAVVGGIFVLNVSRDLLSDSVAKFVCHAWVRHGEGLGILLRLNSNFTLYL